MGWFLWDILEEQGDTNLENQPDAGHNPTRASESVENAILEADFVEQASEERSSTHANSLAHNKEAGQGGPTTDSNDSGIRAVPLAVHPEGERKTADHPSNEDKEKPVGVVCAGIEDVAND